MALKELKAIVANINATNIRVGGFCKEYSKLHDELQLEVDDQHKKVSIVNTDFFSKDFPVFGASETKARILSLPETIDDYEVLLSGFENADTTTQNVKSIKKVVRLDDPSDSQNVGLSLQGPVFHFPYSATIIFADTTCAWDEEGYMYYNEYCVNGYDEPFIHRDFWTEQEREDFIQSYADVIDESVGDRVIRDCRLPIYS